MHILASIEKGRLSPMLLTRWVSRHWLWISVPTKTRQSRRCSMMYSRMVVPTTPPSFWKGLDQPYWRSSKRVRTASRMRADRNRSGTNESVPTWPILPTRPTRYCSFQARTNCIMQERSCRTCTPSVLLSSSDFLRKKTAPSGTTKASWPFLQ